MGTTPTPVSCPPWRSLMARPSERGEGRISRFGPRLLRLTVPLILSAGALTGCGTASAHSSPHQNNTYGAPPSWLPKSTVPVDRIVVARPGDPQLGIEGDTFRAILPHGQTLITVAGPEVPPFVAPPPPTTSATFTISLSHTSGSVPIRPRDFELVDGNRQLFRPQAFSGSHPPAEAPPGRTISFQVTEVMATGAGSIRWSPDGAAMASWDFTVEND
jgi:hypothetical protein